MSTKLHPVGEIPEGPFKAAMLAFKDGAEAGNTNSQQMAEAAVSIMLSTALTLSLRHPERKLIEHAMALAQMLIFATHEAAEEVEKLLGPGETRQ